MSQAIGTKIWLSQYHFMRMVLIMVQDSLETDLEHIRLMEKQLKLL